MNNMALKGVRVAAFSWAWAVPYGTMLLAMMGAEVIKVESERRLDLSRKGAFTTGQKFSGANQSTVFNDLNLNKLGVTINLSQPKGVELAKRLVAVSDVVTQNMRPGVMERMGLGYEDLAKVKPDIIMLSSSACGGTGPERHYGGYAPCFAALGGVTQVTGYPDAAPVPLTGAIDMRSAATAAFAIMAALVYRKRTGRGQYIDLSSREAISAMSGDVLMEYTMNGRNPVREGNRDSVMAPHNVYRCQGENTWVSIAVANDAEWQALCQAMGKPELARDERFAGSFERWQNQEEIDAIVSQWTGGLTSYQVMETLQKVGVAAIPSFTGEQLYNDPHARAREWYAPVEHTVLGKVIVMNPPWKLSATPAAIRSAAPLLGEHNEYVFGELLGMSSAEISRLADEKVIY